MSQTTRNGIGAFVARVLLSVSLPALVACAGPGALTSDDLRQASRDRLERFSQRQQELGTGLTLPQVMVWAMDNNLQLRAEALNRALAQGERQLARVGMLPDVTARAGYNWRSTQAASRSADVVTGNTSLAPSTSSDRQSDTASLEASWSSLDFALAWFRARDEGDKALIAAETRRRMAHQVAMDVLYAWDRAVAFQRVAPAIVSLREDVRAALLRADAVGASGMRDPIDVLDYRTQLLLILKRTDGLVLGMDQARDDLANLLGVPASVDFRLQEAGGLDLALLPAATLEAWQYVALEGRPEVRQSLYARRGAERGVWRRYVEQFPVLSLGYGTRYDSNSYLVHNDWDDASTDLSFSLIRLASLPMHRRQARREKAQAEFNVELQATAVLSQVAIARKASGAAVRGECLSSALASTSARRVALMEHRASAAYVDLLSMVRVRVDDLLVSLERDMARAEARRAQLLLAQSVGLGGWPDVSGADEPARRQADVAHWLGGGLAEEASRRLRDAQETYALTGSLLPDELPVLPECVPAPPQATTGLAEPGITENVDE